MSGAHGPRSPKVALDTRGGDHAHGFFMTPLSLPDRLLPGEVDPLVEPLSPRATTFEQSGANDPPLHIFSTSITLHFSRAWSFTIHELALNITCFCGRRGQT